MESPQPISPNLPFGSAASSRSRSSSKLDDVTSLTSFNPFAEEDENDQSSYAIVTSLLSKVKHTFSAPLSSVKPSAATPAPPTQAPPVTTQSVVAPTAGLEQRRPSLPHSISTTSIKGAPDRPNPLSVHQSNPAPPLVSLTPVTSESPSYVELERSNSQGGGFYASDAPDGAVYGTFIPGFPIADSDARSIRTTASTHVRRSASVSKVIRRIRGEGLSREYWMDDQLCKECYDCKSVFTAWRRKHHCRICGQIYCSRCASNIIKGTRFGHDGMVRICNLCLDKLAKVDDDDDDSRSVVSTTTSPFTPHQLGADSRSFNHLSHLANLPQSPFAASQLFGRNDSFSLFSIAETKRPNSGSEENGPGSRPITPGDDLEDNISRPNHAPFRRALTEDEKDPMSLSSQYSQDSSPYAQGSKTPIDFPVTVPVSVDGSASSIAFPVSPPDQSATLDSPVRSRYNSFADLHARSRVQSRLGDHHDAGEGGWRTRRESTAYAQELNTISMFHLRSMLRQLLTTEAIPNIKEWEETLLKISLRIARELTFTAHPQRSGADMDVRRYVKIKKIPGGAPKDSEYVDGAVITKNVAHKSMLKTQRNPRVMLITFPLEFHRVEGQYMHFGQIILQEKDYLGNLAARIASLRPHVVLAEKSVSRLALENLANRNIAVARTVKPSAIQLVARMTQGDVLSSIDKLALEPRLGHCAKFRVQTFDHPLIPGRRKTYMRFEGCSREMGCTIILRGGDIDTLRRVKKVTRFLAFIVRNLRLETHLWKDSVITLPTLPKTATPQSFLSNLDAASRPSSPIEAAQVLVSTPSNSPPRPSSGNSGNTEPEDLLGEEAEQRHLSRRIQDSLEPYVKTFISVSATIRFLPPYPIRRMKELDDELIRVKQQWEDDLVRREEQSAFRHEQEETITESATPVVAVPQAADTQELAAQIESLPLPDIPSTPTTTPGEQPGYFDSIHITSMPLAPLLTASPAPLIIEEVPIQPKTVEDIALESRLSYVKREHEEARRIWEWYLRKNKDDFDVEKYQCISLWEFTLPIAEYGLHRACFPPQLRYITFYGENDCTLGQFIERSVRETLVKFLDPKAVCAGKGCGQPIGRHCKVYVHNETRLFVAVEQWDGQITDSNGYHAHATPDTIITWSACRVCGSATPFIPVSEEMQRYSFAKFLELHFYPADVQLVQGAGCQHNIYRHHIRYFANLGMTVRFQADSVVLHEVIYPPMRIRVRPETQLEIKNRDFERLHHRNQAWYTALIDDLKLITIDAATGDEAADALLTAQINALILRAEWEKNDVTRFINQVYKESAPTDTLALNQVRAKRQDLIVAWQQDFDKLPKPRVSGLTDRAGRRMSSAFGTVKAIWPGRRFDLEHPFTSANVSEAEEFGASTSGRVTRDSYISTSTYSASEASETESNYGGEQETHEAQDVSEAPAEVPVTATLHEGNPEHVSDQPTEAMAAKEGGESDSTVEAVGMDKPKEPPIQPLEISLDSDPEAEANKSSQLMSRLPRRAAHRPSVAELVKRYQEYLPPQGVEELARTALPPNSFISESEQESAPVSYTRSRIRTRSKTRGQVLSKKSSMSDFEQSYAANIAPKYLTQTRRSIVQPGNSRIPVPVIPSSTETYQPSRRPSPEKRPSMTRMHADSILRGDASRLSSIGSFVAKGRGKSTARTVVKDDKPRPPRTGTIRRATVAGNKVTNIAKHFERISRDSERANRRYAVIRGRRARPVATARAKVEVLESIKDAINDEEESDASDSSEADDEGGDEEDTHPSKRSTGGNSLVSIPSAVSEATPEAAAEPPPTEGGTDEAELAIVLEAPKEDELLRPPTPVEAQPVVSVPLSPALPPLPTTPAASSPMEFDLSSMGPERLSILKTLAGLWPQQPQPSRIVDIDDPMSDPEHIFRESCMVVRTDEPTSIIALALNSPQYRDMLAKSRAEKRQAREPKLTDGEVFMPDDRSVAESTSTWGVVNVDSTDVADPTEELRVPSSKLPWAITYESGGLTISCTVLFPEQFDALRRTYDCERSLVESLARCVKWDASGGKSGSAFLKTLDDRFIAKELSRAELQAMENFAPAYFDYMSSAVTANRPTLLAKIFGCYKISFRKTHKDRGSKSRSTQMNLLVMENLFYDRRFSKIYDLKGSTRNRHVQSTGRENEVLLDENLVETAHLYPFYLREHSKRILRGALYNDSKFLADINVMDYSLVVGVDSVNNELVVGIVDYIRTYTWDKKLESWVKDSTFLGGANKGEPTIIGPRQYRQRFLSAMERYFPVVPDRWMKQHDAPEEEGNNLLDLWPDW